MAARGGKRPGAGRPQGSSVLDSIEIITVAAQCERLWAAACQEKLEAARAALFGKSDYDELIANFRAEPLVDRWQYFPVCTSNGDDEYRTYAGEQHHDDVEGALKEMADLPVEDPLPAPRWPPLSPVRPYRIRGSIILEVAEWATAKFDKRVTPGLVRSAWKMARSVRLD